MWPFHSCYVCETWRSKEVGGLKLSYGGKEKSHIQGELPRELTTELLNLELPVYFNLFWSKKINALYKIPPY